MFAALRLPDDAPEEALSSALDGLNNTIASLLGFLAGVLAPGALRRITRHTCGTIQKEIYDKLLLRHNFSAAGASQLRRSLDRKETSKKTYGANSPSLCPTMSSVMTTSL